MRKNASPEVITIGETMVLVTPTEALPLETAADFHLVTGGAESNVALHLASLGHTASWVSQLGDDALGRRIARHLLVGRVDTRWLRIHPEAPTGVYFKDPGRGVRYYRSGSAASHMDPAFVAEIALEGAAVVHLSGITAALSPGCRALVHDVMRRVRPTAALLSFDVNHRPALWTTDDAPTELASLASQADIVFVGLDEAQLLWGTRTAEEVRALLPAPQRLVVKDGEIGATEFDGAASCFVPAIPTEVVEAVGAGDAFAAGYLSAQLRGHPAAERLRSGHRQAVLALRSTSDVPQATPGSPERSSHA